MTDTTDEMSAIQDALAGTWSIERELGRGGMGTVYLARDVSLDRPVAIKVLHRDLAQRPDQRDRFLREAQTAARLAHPHIVPIYTIGHAADTIYFVMGLVDGESLGARVHRDGPLPMADVSCVLRDIGWALGYAHAMGVLHRDVTLDNILIERRTGRALLADFGIAAEVERATEAPLVGTPAYMAPELIEGHAPSVQSDLYAFGITAWAMLAGRLPFHEPDAAATLIQHVSTPMPSLAQAAPGTPSQMVRAIEHALAKDPTTRSRDVESWLAELRPEGAVTPLAPPLQRWVDRWQGVRAFYALAAGITAMLVGAMGSAALSLYAPVWQVLLELVRDAALMLVVPILAHRIVELGMLRGLLRAGYRADDLRLATAREQAEPRRRETDQPSFAARLNRDVLFFSLALYLFSTILARILTHDFTTILPNPFPTPRHPHLWYRVSDQQIEWMFARFARWSIVTFWSSMGLSFIVPTFRLKPGGWIARLHAKVRPAVPPILYRLASIDLPRTAAAEHTLHRPTELVLDLAIDDLWSALPDDARQRLKELPAVADSLRERVGEIKDLMRQLEAPSLVDAPEAVALRQRLGERQDAGITALERLRLQLMKLSGHNTMTGALTERLRDAHALEGELLTELGGHPSLKRLLKRKDAPKGLTPTPSPA